MNAPSTQTGRLVLTPESAALVPPVDLLLANLRELGFIGSPLKGGPANCFLVGDNFLQLITFMGCAPHIKLEPPAGGGSFCHIRLEGPWREPRLLHGHNTQPPRCAQCRARLPQWEQELDHWCAYPTRAQVLCGRCGRRQSALDLQWRQNAGFGRLFLMVEDIFPGEAIPVPGLMQSLERTSGSLWVYFYIRD